VTAHRTSTATATATTAAHRPPGARGRTQAERRASSERKLLDTTAQLIAERGTTSVSFADIARAAGCSHGLPGYLFGSKTDLLLALIDDVLRALRRQTFDPATRQTQGLTSVAAALRAFVESLARPTSYTRAMYVLLGEAPGGPPEVRAALVAYQDGVRGVFRDMVREGIDRGEVRPDVDPDDQAVLVLGLARGIGQQVVLDPASVDVRTVAPAVADAVTRWLGADPGDEHPHRQHVPRGGSGRRRRPAPGR
jgi:AcrR family transcriptional regulator